MKSEKRHKKMNSTNELDMVLTKEESFQTVYDNSDTFKRKVVSASNHSVSTPDTEASSFTFERPRRRRHKRRPSSQLMLCGALSAEDEIVGDAKTSLRQIVSTLKTFGPDEKEAVKDMLVESANVIKGTLRKIVGQCSKGRNTGSSCS